MKGAVQDFFSTLAGVEHTEKKYVFIISKSVEKSRKSRGGKTPWNLAKSIIYSTQNTEGNNCYAISQRDMCSRKYYRN